MTVNTGVSDLYFNYDKSEAEKPRGSKNEFAGYEDEAVA